MHICQTLINCKILRAVLAMVFCLDPGHPLPRSTVFSSRIDTAFGVSWSLSALAGTPLHGPQSFSGWACASCSPSLCTLTSAVQHDQFAGTSSLRLSGWNLMELTAPSKFQVRYAVERSRRRLCRCAQPVTATAAPAVTRAERPWIASAVNAIVMHWTQRRDCYVTA